ncbi:hypothetical protein GOBAR_DD03493 [Gossypium barbadense]|nr:hypothetical protein GOBAR_DD03493 [Gossypium barbadense]
MNIFGKVKHWFMEFLQLLACLKSKYLTSLRQSSVLLENNHTTENDGIANSSEDNSSSPTENCSTTDDPNLLDAICSDESLLNSLWMDEPPLVDVSWTSVSAGETNCNLTSLPSWEEDCAWLLDCQDFGANDFGFDYLDDIELNTLEMGDKSSSLMHRS